MRARFPAAGLVLLLAAAGCTSALVTGGTPQTLPPQPGSTTDTVGSTAGSPVSTRAVPEEGASVVPGGVRCSYRQQQGYVLPDPACTPGATNPDVTQADIAMTICARGWTSTVRLAESYTEPLKREQMGWYGSSGSISGYEEDHLIPLELGGSPADLKNLWPEPGSSPNPKDDVEYAANRAVCSGEMSLALVQREIATDWVSLGRSLGVLKGTN